MARWPWHRTAFYVEWLQQIVEESQREEPEPPAPGSTSFDDLVAAGVNYRQI